MCNSQHFILSCLNHQISPQSHKFDHKVINLAYFQELVPINEVDASNFYGNAVCPSASAVPSGTVMLTNQVMVNNAMHFLVAI